MKPVTEVTAELIAKAQELIKGQSPVQKALTSASGFAGYDLQPIAILLQPVITPLRNRLPRVGPNGGGTSAEWRYISSLISKGVTTATPSAEGAKGNALSYAATPVTAAFAEKSLSDSVTQAALDAAKGFEDDLKARAHTNLLYALMMLEERDLLFDRVTALGTITTPTLVVSTSAGGIGAGTFKVYVRPITGNGDGTITRGKKSAAATTAALSGSTNQIIAYTTWVEGAIGYEWYVDDGASGTATLQTTTGVNAVVLNALTTSGAALPADNSANAIGMNGLVAQLTAANGAQITTLATDTTAGLGTDFTLAHIDGLNKLVWDTAKGNPEVIYMNSTQRMRATNLVLVANGAPTLFVQAGTEDMAEITGGYLLAKYINKATGRVQRVETHPDLPDGTMLAMSHMIPFPTGGDMVGVDIQVSTDYRQIDYAQTSNKYEFGVFCREVLRMKFPGGAWVLRNIKSNVNG